MHARKHERRRACTHARTRARHCTRARTHTHTLGSLHARACPRTRPRTGVFDHTSSLEEVFLYVNQMTELPPGSHFPLDHTLGVHVPVRVRTRGCVRSCAAARARVSAPARCHISAPARLHRDRAVFRGSSCRRVREASEAEVARPRQQPVGKQASRGGRPHLARGVRACPDIENAAPLKSKIRTPKSKMRI